MFSLKIRSWVIDIRNLLINNNYPPQIIDNEFKKYEKYKQLNVEKVVNPDEKIKYISIPFNNDKSEIIGLKKQQSLNCKRLLSEIYRR